MRRAVDGAAPPLFLQVPGPRGAEEVARAHATATQTPCTHGYVETGRRWRPSRWSRRLVAVPDSSCLQRSSPGRCWSRRRSSLVRVVSTWRHLDLRLGRRDADGGRTRNCWAHLALRLDLHAGPGIRSRRHRRDVPPTQAPRTSNSSSPSPASQDGGAPGPGQPASPITTQIYNIDSLIQNAPLERAPRRGRHDE